MPINDFPRDSAEHVAQEALKATNGDHHLAIALLNSAVKAMQLWHQMALETAANDA